MPTIEEKVHAAIGEVLEVPAKKIANDKAFVADLGADQLDIVEILMTLEDTFDIAISDDAVEGLATVGQLVEVVTSLLQK